MAKEGMLVSIYRRGGDVADTQGLKVSDRFNECILVGHSIPALFSPRDDAPVLYCVRRQVMGSDFFIAVPELHYEGRFAFGGNFCFSSDSRFPGKGVPIKIFDYDMRMEKGNYD